MQNREEWENGSRSETILVSFNHETKKTESLVFGGGVSYRRAIEYRNNHQKPTCSYALIANEAASLEYGYYMLSLVGESPDVPEEPEEHFH